jgi:hypothetical protein
MTVYVMLFILNIPTLILIATNQTKLEIVYQSESQTAINLSKCIKLHSFATHFRTHRNLVINNQYTENSGNITPYTYLQDFMINTK